MLTLNPRLTQYSNDDLLGLLDLATLSADFAPESVEFTPTTPAGWDIAHTFAPDSPSYNDMIGSLDQWTLADVDWYAKRGWLAVINGDRQTLALVPAQ